MREEVQLQYWFFRLDVENKLSEQLKKIYIKCKTDDKDAVLLHLLQKVIPSNQQSVVFCATKHHVEYLQTVCITIYDNLLYPLDNFTEVLLRKT